MTVRMDRPAGQRSAERRSDGLLALFRAAVAAGAERLAVAPPRGEGLTYGELDGRAAAVAGELVRCGVEPGSQVVVLCGERAPVIPAVLGTLAAGCVFVPLDPAQPDRRLATLLSAVSPAAYLVSGDQRRRLPSASVPTISIDALEPADGGLDAGRAPAPDDLAYVYFTSGSTGVPKPVAGRLKGVEHFLRWQRELVGAAAGLRVSQLTSPGFDAWLRDVFLPLTCGGSVHLPPGDGDGVDARRLVAWLDASGVEVVHCVPSVLRALLGEPLTPDLFPGLRWLFLAGERLLPADLERWFGVFGPRVQLVNLYGATETTMTKLFHLVEPADATAARVPVGRPMPGVRALVVDREGRPCPDGTVGEIWIRTPYRSQGYLGRSDETREVFVPNPFSDDPADLVYRSGDYGLRRRDGLFELHGRRDDMVKVRGARVELGEVENVLRRHPAVRDLAVVDRRGVGGDTWLAAYVVGDVEEDELARHCARSLPSWMVPSVFVPLAELPRTVSGKVDRHALPDPVSRAGGRPPRGEVEKALARIWSRLLGRDDISADDDFFRLGGHSLLATRLQSHVRNELGADVGLVEIFDHPVLGELAGAVAAARGRGRSTAAPPLEPAPPGAEPCLSLAEERLWLLWRLAPRGAGAGAYNMARSLRLRGDVDLAALRGAFAEVGRRHEVLRTTYPERDGRPVRRVSPAGCFRLPVVDLSALPSGPRRDTARRLARREARQPFDLAAGGTFRARLLRLSPADHALLVTQHHIAGDAWSLDVLAGELGTLYGAFSAGRPSPLPEPRLQYRDVAAWERRWLEEEPLDDDLAFWRRELAGAPEAVELPADRPRPPLPSFRGGSVPVSLEPGVTDGVSELARRCGATPFMVLLAAFATLLKRRGGQPDVVVGTSVTNRAHPDTEGMVGLFVNQVPLRVDLAGDPTFRRLLSRVRRTALDAFTHQRVPFQLLLDEVKPRRAPGRNPLFQVMLELDQRPDDGSGVAADRTLILEPLPGERERARIDLTLFLARRRGRLEGKLEYSADLFDEPTVRDLAASLEALLSDAVARPDTRIERLRLTTPTERQEKLVKQNEDLRANLDRFKTIEPRAVEVPQGELVESRELEPGREMPLLLVPASDGVDLADWAEGNRQRLDRELLDHGAVLFRGFSVDGVDAFETVARALCGELFRDSGEHDRETVSGDVATPTFYPPEKKLLWHNENSFNHRWPGRIVFGCQTPAVEGGETPLADSREMYRRIDPEVRRRFRALGVQYVRNYGSGFGLDWQTVFQTDSRDEVERRCAEEGMEVEWLDGGRLRTRCTRPAVIRHPDSGAWSWFNQAQHFHPACLDQEVRGSLVDLFGGGDEMPRNCRYGDGSQIPDADMEAILDLYREIEVSFPWQSGDVLVVDNVLAAHARNPYRGERNLFIGMGRMYSYDTPGVRPGEREDG